MGLAMARTLIELCSLATCWQDLARDLVDAIGQLEAQIKQAAVERDDRSILLTVEPGMSALRLAACRSDGVVITPEKAGIRLCFSALPADTDQGRDDGMVPPNASIDRAASKAAADMISWAKDPDTFELVEYRRFTLFLAWHEHAPFKIDEFAYGLWDE
jgi:hypothetical protein